MLTFYYHPLSPISRRVWWALLEKGIAFKPVVVNLMGDQMKPEFVALNPFHHVPVLVDGDFRLVESLAILDYLEGKYPDPSLLPTDLKSLAIVRMVQMVVTNEMMTQIPRVVAAKLASDPGTAAFETAIAPVKIGLQFLADHLDERPFFGSGSLTVADIVAGTAVGLLNRLGVSLTPYPVLGDWYARLEKRPAWQHTSPSDHAFITWERYVGLMIKRRQKAA